MTIPTGEPELQGFSSIHASAALPRSAPAVFVLSDRLDVVLQYLGEPECVAIADRKTNRLSPIVERAVRSLIAQRSVGASNESRIIELDRRYVVTLLPLRGASARLIAVRIEPFRRRNALARAAHRFSLTKREVDVLALILGGATSREIAGTLHITETTVQGYSKQLLNKTATRTRAAMVARVLEWTSESPVAEENVHEEAV